MSILSQFLDNPGPAHAAAVRRVLGYVPLTRDMGLVLVDTGNRDGLVSFSDADGGTVARSLAMFFAGTAVLSPSRRRNRN